MSSNDFYRSVSYADCRVGSIELFYLNNFKDKARGSFFFEAGAVNGFHLTQTATLESLGWSGILVEAHQKLFNDLKNSERKAICTNHVLGDGRACLFEEKKSGLLGHSQIRNEPTNDDCVPCVTTKLEDVLKECQAPQVIDYMVIDVELAWPLVLEGIDFENREIDFLAVEMKGHDESVKEHWLDRIAEHGMKFVYALGREDYIFSRFHDDQLYAYNEPI